MLVVDNDSLLTGGFVGTQVLMNTPVTAPVTQNTTTAAAKVTRQKLDTWLTVSGQRLEMRTCIRWGKSMVSHETVTEINKHVHKKGTVKPVVTHGMLPDSSLTAIQS